MTNKQRLKFYREYIGASNAASGSKYDSNANITQKNIATLSYEMPKLDNISFNNYVMREYITKYFGKSLGKRYGRDLADHIIYRHDNTSGSGGFPYCCSISLYPFLLDGLKKLGAESGPPKHANSFIGGLINLIFLVAGQFVGAVAIPEFLTYFDHFLRADYGDDYIDHLDDTVEINGHYAHTLRQMIEDWFQQLIFTINAPASARGYQSVFINIAYFDQYYFKSIFKDFVFPDGDEPNWETTKELQKMFMRWFNSERDTSVLTFPVESFNILVEDGKYKDEEMADFAAEMWEKKASFFMYQSDSVDSLSSCCRLRNGVEENVFSYTLGAGGIETGSKAVITLNLNRIVQDWYRKSHRPFFKYKGELEDYIEEITSNVHKYLKAFNYKLWDDFNSGILTVYSAGFIDLDKQFLTVGVNGFVEAAEFLKLKGYDIEVDPYNEGYKKLSLDILGTIEKLNRAHRDDHVKYNLEFVPGENASYKLYTWDKRDGYVVPSGRNLYNSYFYVVEDPTIDPVKKFYYQGKGFADVCSGGVALHNNLDSHLTKQQYRRLMDIAVEAGCNYFTFNIPGTICCDCNYKSKDHLSVCPRCGSTRLDAVTRIIGYLRRVSNFSEARQEEFSRRSFQTKDSIEKYNLNSEEKLNC